MYLNFNGNDDIGISVATSKAKILSIETENIGEETIMTFKFGAAKLSKTIPNGHSLSRASAILNDNGELVDCELITEKV